MSRVSIGIKGFRVFAQLGVFLGVSQQQGL